MKTTPSLFPSSFSPFCPRSFLRTLLDRGPTAIGLLCLIATLGLLPVGVRTVQAGDHPGADAPSPDEPAAPESGVSIDPLLVEAAEQVGRAPADGDTVNPREARRLPGASAAPGAELAPGEIVLNPRGYNYDSEITDLGPAALDLERFLSR